MSVKSFFKGVCKAIGVTVATAVTAPLAIGGAFLIIGGVILQAIGTLVLGIVGGASLLTCCCAPCVAPIAVGFTAFPILAVGELAINIGAGCMIPFGGTMAWAGCCKDDSYDPVDNRRVKEASFDAGENFQAIVYKTSFTPAIKNIAKKHIRREGQPDVEEDLERGANKHARSNKSPTLTYQYQAQAQQASNDALEPGVDQKVQVAANEYGAGESRAGRSPYLKHGK